ncbi:hypothetical protein [Streptomyces aureoversilis]|uniref:Uncharacterized protein n=1 Tax=Streptomyces aureoversilis TaxID=67277 RepID=A0ABV9ZV06_9ACTN
MSYPHRIRLHDGATHAAQELVGYLHRYLTTACQHDAGPPHPELPPDAPVTCPACTTNCTS